MNNLDKQKKRKGNCFEEAFNLITQTDSDQFVGIPFLVHGIAWHEVTGWHVHGWVEDDIFCYDYINKRLFATPKEQYYSIGKIKQGVGEIFRYTREAAIKLALKTNLYYFSKLPCDI